jgi:hypothetical protein
LTIGPIKSEGSAEEFNSFILRHPSLETLQITLEYAFSIQVFKAISSSSSLKRLIIRYASYFCFKEQVADLAQIMSTLEYVEIQSIMVEEDAFALERSSKTLIYDSLHSREKLYVFVRLSSDFFLRLSVFLGSKASQK